VFVGDCEVVVVVVDALIVVVVVDDVVVVGAGDPACVQINPFPGAH
jgi:hypothetical protein